ncbi:hypothetical protein BTVI_119701 [Pitangus sulphuratus]|nr:hypothetical protein BTVI_119701 [Pitangus sulphuratus]
MRMGKGLEGKPREEQLRWLVQLGGHRENLMVVFNILTSGSRGANIDLITSDRTRGEGMKLSQGRFRLDIRKRFFTQRVVEHWNRLPREVITAPNLSEFRKHLDNAFRRVVGLLEVSCAGPGVGLTGPDGSLPTQHIR